MNKIFDQNSPFWKAMGRIFDVFVLNILWLLCCIPLFTIGPATTALFYSMFGIIRGDGGYVSRDFFKSFKQNFKQGLQLGIPLTLLGLFLSADMYLSYHAGRGIYSFFLFFFLVIFLLWIAVTLYVFPILSKFERTNKEILIWAFTSCIRHLPKTLYMMFVLLAALWLCHLAPGLILIAFGLVAEIHANVLLGIFAPYLPTPYEMENPDDFVINPDDDVNKWLL